MVGHSKSDGTLRQMGFRAGMNRSPSLPSLAKHGTAMGFNTAPIHAGERPNRRNPRWALAASANTSTDPLEVHPDGSRDTTMRRHLDLSLSLRTPLPRLAAAHPSTPALRSAFRTGKKNTALQMHRGASLPCVAPKPTRPELLTTRANHSDFDARRASAQAELEDIFRGRAGHDDQRVALDTRQRGRSPSLHILAHPPDRHVRFQRTTPTKTLPATPDATPPLMPSHNRDNSARTGDTDVSSMYSELSAEFGEEVDENELFYQAPKVPETSFMLTPSPDPAAQAFSIGSALSPRPSSGALTSSSPVPIPGASSPVGGIAQRSFLTVGTAESGDRVSPSVRSHISLSARSHGTHFSRISPSLSPIPPLVKSPEPLQMLDDTPASSNGHGLEVPTNSFDSHSPTFTARSSNTQLSDLPDLAVFPAPPQSPRSSYELGPTSERMSRTISV